MDNSLTGGTIPIGAVSGKDIYKRMGVEKDYPRVKNDIIKMIHLIAQSVNITLSDKDLPAIDIQPGTSSAFDGSRNIIHIVKEHIDNGESYAAEIGHFFKILCYWKAL